MCYSDIAVREYGALQIDAASAWPYTLQYMAVESMRAGDHMVETSLVAVSDSGVCGTAQAVTITVNGTNDAPVINSTTTTATGAVTEDGTATATGKIIATDVDTGATLSYSGNASSAYGSFAIDAAGAWTYTLNNSAAQTLRSSDHIV